MNINFNKIFKKIIPYLTILVIAYAFSVIAFLLLPKVGVNVKDESSQLSQSKFFNIKIFESNDIKKSTTIQNIEKKEYRLLSNLTLNAVYSKNDGSGWIIIKENSTSKTHILKSGESFKNYVLKTIFPSYVIFENNSKEYKLSIKEKRKKFNIITKKDSNDNWSEKLIFDGNKVSIQRKFLDTYVNNIDKVWQDIKIDEVKKDGFIIGFKVSQITKNSLLSKLGLKVGDIIKKINSVELNNYNKAFKIYREIKSMKNLNIEILRNNRKMELNYEIN